MNTKKKIKIKYKHKYKIIKGKNNYSSNKVINVEKQKYFSNNQNNNNNNNNDKLHHKKIANYKQTEIKIPILENILENQLNINKKNEKIIDKKKSDNNINSARKKVINIYEQSNRESYFINKEKKSPTHQQNQKINNINIKNEKEQKNNIKAQNI